MSFLSALPAATVRFSTVVVPVWMPRRVKRGDIIIPRDHNVFILYWQQRLSQLDALRPKVAERVPDRVEEYDAAVGLLRAHVSSMPTVKWGDYVYSDHFNARLTAVDLFLSIADFMVSTVLGAPSDLVEMLEGIWRLRSTLTVKRSGDIITASDHNALVDIAEACLNLMEMIEQMLTGA